MEKPKNVSLAVMLIWASMVVGPIYTVFFPPPEAAQVPFASIAVVLLFTVVILAFLTWKISAGRNWARITFTVLFALGLLPTLFLLPHAFQRAIPSGLLSVVQILMQGYGVVLLFSKSGSAWFRRDTSEGDAAA